MSTDHKRNQLTQELNRQLRYVSANSVMFSQVVAEKVGIHSTDNECLDFLILNGPSTAGQLAELTGLTTGAVTAMIDRLEKADYVKRERDKADRRKVIVVPNEEKIYLKITPYVMPMGMAMDRLSQEFSEDELAIILKFITKANAAATEVISEVRKAGARV
jgi:DNA-binding MarR family transcriptional regulator